MEDYLSLRAYKFALNELGLFEISGPENNPRIIEYQKSVKGLEGMESDSDVPWCSCAHNFCMQSVGGVGTRDASARSWLLWGNKVNDPKKGDTVILSRGLDPSKGHVGFFCGQNTNSILILGGNQEDCFSALVYPKYRVIGYRRSKDA
jgi:uncharacterized protein (TIGR02594 family)